MDELELLKKDWEKKDPAHKKLSAEDLYPILHKKSSSIVKTLFFISVGELIFWILVNTIPYFTSDSYQDRLNSIYTNEYVFTGLTVISYIVILLFVYLLFKAHKSISVTDSAKNLMENILKTRKVIKYYVIYNLVMAFASMVIGIYIGIFHDPEVSAKIANFSNKQLLFTYTFIVFVTAIFVLIIWLFYKLLYGLLLRRLNRNYKELKKLEV